MSPFASDFLCMAVSPDGGFICNEKANHDGDHVARARAPGGDDYEVDRWENKKTPARRQRTSSGESE